MEIETLNEERLGYWCSRIDIPEGAQAALVQKLHETMSDPRLLAIFQDFYHNTVLPGRWPEDWDHPLPFDPYVKERFGEEGASLFYLLAYMSGLPAAEALYHQMGVGMDIFHDTFLDIRIWLLRAFEEHQRWRFGQFQWIALHLKGEIFRLGRLQFALKEYEEHPIVLRHKTSGEIRLLCGPEIPLRPDGYALGAGRWTEDQPIEGEGWHAIFEETPQGWRGNLIAPLGYALREPVCLPKTEWEIALRHGDTLLDFHIPRGDKMSMEECRDSVRRGYAFYAEHAPHRPIKAGFCHTWFFTPQLQQILPRESNIVRFQREFYLFPYPGSAAFLWDYTFGGWVKDPAAAPRDTSLQRAVLSWLDQGGELFDLPGLMFHTADQWGAQPYFTAWEEQHAK
jgi:hypothetical protein